MRRKRYPYDFDHRELSRDPINAKLGGVCAGIGRYIDVPNFFVRTVAVVALCVAPQATLIAYGVAYLILEPRP